MEKRFREGKEETRHRDTERERETSLKGRNEEMLMLQSEVWR